MSFLDRSKCDVYKGSIEVIFTNNEEVYKFNNALISRENKRGFGSILHEGVLKCYYRDFNSIYKLQNFDSYYSKLGGK